MFLMKSMYVFELSGKFSGMMYQNSVGVQNSISEPPQTQNYLKCFIHFGLGLTLARDTNKTRK